MPTTPAARQSLPAPAVLVPLVTPVEPGGRPDLQSLGSLVDFVIAAGVDGVLVLGSSGEAAGFPAVVRQEIATHVVGHVAGRVHVMVGVPPAGAGDQIEHVRAVSSVGPDSILVTAPIGLDVSPAEVTRQFEAVSAVAEAPVVAYEVPGRVGVSLGVPVIRDLAARGVVAGLKDSSGNLGKGRQIAVATRDIDGFVRYTGTETSIDSELAAGYDGSIPGIANVFPDFSVEVSRRHAAGDPDGARRVQDAVVELLDLYSHPVPDGSVTSGFLATVKTALVQLGVIATVGVTRPLTPADPAVTSHVARVLARADELRGALGMGGVATRG
ncbi:dihydrodipicolinate synthase family protein [Desertimonas flava]|uniref:dihydrodipicolinate synthase family protein n=1 Tax=Desertimonas flava TaxID=2064846 RepID=UPI0013C45C6F|nr:dihydrodipicolinate synthase family protein [Desertimonas flava]